MNSRGIPLALYSFDSQVMNEKLADEPPLRQFVKKRLDTFMAVVVSANISVMVLMTQWAGRNSDVVLGLEEEAWPFFSQEFFDGLEYVSWCLRSFLFLYFHPIWDAGS